MNLKSFIEICKKDVDNFEQQWNDGKKENPEYFPDEISEGQWFDQFLTFLTSNKEN